MQPVLTARSIEKGFGRGETRTNVLKNIDRRTTSPVECSWLGYILAPRPVP